MQFTSEQRLDHACLQRDFNLGEIPGILWTPASSPAPLILLGHPGGLRTMYPRLAARARHSVAEGFAAATIELPGSGDRPAEEDRAERRRPRVSPPHLPGRQVGPTTPNAGSHPSPSCVIFVLQMEG